MANQLLLTLLGGVFIISTVLLLIYRLSDIGGKGAAVITALMVIGIYIPIAILFWPGADVFAIHIAVYLVNVYVLGIITSQRDLRNHQAKTQPWFHWGPATIVLFFMMVISVDSVFIMLAQKGLGSDIAHWLLPQPLSGGKVSSFFPGTVGHDFRQKANHYNAFQQRLQQQVLRDWKIQKGWVKTPKSGEIAEFKLSIHDKHDQPLTRAKVQGRFMRPSNSRFDVNFTMQELAGGLYLAKVVLPYPGRWDLNLQISHNKALHEITATTTIASADK